MVLRAVQIDLDTADKALRALQDAYAADIKAREISDDVIREVGTIIDRVRGALDKTANQVAKRYAVGQKAPVYFPIATDPEDFEAELDKNIRGLRRNYPEIANAFARHQPYTPGSESLRYLRALYRVHRHHDFVLQEHGERSFQSIRVGGMHVLTIGRGGMRIGGPPPDTVLTEAEVTRGADVEVIHGKALDWRFKDPPVSVVGTLRGCYQAAVGACQDIGGVAEL